MHCDRQAMQHRQVGAPSWNSMSNFHFPHPSGAQESDCIPTTQTYHQSTPYTSYYNGHVSVITSSFNNECSFLSPTSSSSPCSSSTSSSSFANNSASTPGTASINGTNNWKLVDEPSTKRALKRKRKPEKGKSSKQKCVKNKDKKTSSLRNSFLFDSDEEDDYDDEDSNPIHNIHQRYAANMRERKRMQSINQAFEVRLDKQTNRLVLIY